ncbi:major facilitator superfamily domain-containing protein 6 isoform X4 [Hydra vulgaris]|uniref:Major facilitator superfamily domain-containing protein 6 isoform X4 n=1 Tax=Hydra vulgaris TaxID=6087 RepID=A0ABM4CVS8_HYDVU
MFMKDFLLDDSENPSDMSIQCDNVPSISNMQCENCEKKVKKKEEILKGPLNIKVNIDKDLLQLKGFFLLFFAGFGSTLPYLGVYFMQIGINPTKVGILAGIRPIIQFISGPFWAFLADKYKARKAILLFSILAWLVMTLLLAFPRPHREVCKITNTSYSEAKIRFDLPSNFSQRKDFIPGVSFQGRFGELLYTKNCMNCKSSKFVTTKDINENFVLNNKIKNAALFENGQHFLNTEIKTINKRHSIKNLREKTVEHIATYRQKNFQIKYVIERDKSEIKDIFYVLLVLTIIGEFLEAPSFIMIDTALLEHLGENKKHYGKTRLFGSIGYGSASFIVGAVLNNFQYEFCGKAFTNYMVLFYLFSIFMGIAFVFGLSFIKFRYVDSNEATRPIDSVKIFLTLKYGSFLAICWFFGLCHGSIMNSLNWYLEDLGASKLMMDIATACRCAAIIIGFFLSGYLIDKFGHIKLICWALGSYVISFFCYASLKNPWWAIPIEVAQGLIYATSWSTCITYLSEATPQNTAATMQGILQAVYWGLGTGSGAIFGGSLINLIGVRNTFIVEGITSLIIFALYCLLQVTICRKEKLNKDKK